MRNLLFLLILTLAPVSASQAQECIVDYVNPFIGTTNFGTCNPGAVTPGGLMSVVPFNVMGSSENRYDKDARWWSTPYEFTNCYFTGYAHVNLSGVGCPELGSLLLMPTTGALSVDYTSYGSRYRDEKASPGYFSNYLPRYNILTEVSATPRSGVSRFTFPAGESHILLNLGEGLTNESGAFIRQSGPCEWEGTKLLGTFCYCPQAVFPIHFVMRVNKQPQSSGYWKKQRPMTGVEAEWDPDNGKYKLYTHYKREMAGDDIGLYLNYETQEGEQIEVQMGVSFVSIEGARRNLEAEQSGKSFAQVHVEAREKWQRDLSRIEVEGGSDEQKRVFYTALYHLLIHPNLLSDVDGRYPAMESDQILTTSGRRYTVFSLWDTYRNVHQLLTLLYPERQLQMVRSMIEMYREHGWLPKWELYGRETYTMEGDPATAVIADTWLKGLRDFDISTAYEAMRKSALTAGAENPLRPDNDDYMQLGYVPLRETYDNSVSHALEYYVADHALSLLAADLARSAAQKGDKEAQKSYEADARLFRQRSLGYRHYYSRESGTLRPLLPDGSFLTPFNPRQGENFEPCPGFHEGSAWNYTFYVPHDVDGLIRLMGGRRPFVEKLQKVFDEGLYDPANEPDISYAHLFSRIPGEEWRTQKLIHELIAKHFRNAPDGLPGNEDTGTMSAWVIFNMLGFYPDCPGEPAYTLTSPLFTKATLHLDPKVWGRDTLIFESTPLGESPLLQEVQANGRRLKRYRITHDELLQAGGLRFVRR